MIRDDAVSVYPLIARSSDLIYVSRIFCGSYDVPMKTMLERSIPVQQAFIRLYHGETHHMQRAVVEKDAVISGLRRHGSGGAGNLSGTGGTKRP